MKIQDFLKCEHDIDMNTSMTSLYCVKCGQDANVIKLVDEMLEVIKFYATENMWLGVSDGHTFGRIKWLRIVADDMDSDDLGGKKAREYLQRMESEK